MRKMIRFDKEPHIYEMTDEEYAEWEIANAKEIERRRIKRGHDEAQALKNAERKRDAHWQGVMAEVVAEKDAELARLRAQLEEVLAQNDRK